MTRLMIALVVVLAAAEIIACRLGWINHEEIGEWAVTSGGIAGVLIAASFAMTFLKTRRKSDQPEERIP